MLRTYFATKSGRRITSRRLRSDWISPSLLPQLESRALTAPLLGPVAGPLVHHGGGQLESRALTAPLLGPEFEQRFGGIFQLESRALTAPLLVLNLQNPGIGANVRVVGEPTQGPSDHTDGKMQVHGEPPDQNISDFSGDGTTPVSLTIQDNSGAPVHLSGSFTVNYAVQDSTVQDSGSGVRDNYLWPFGSLVAVRQ